MNENRNIFLAIALSIGILLGWEFFFAKNPAPQPQAQNTSAPAGAPGAAPGAVPGQPAAQAPVSRADYLAQAPRVKISTPSLSGSISLLGARLDDLSLVRYHETIDPSSPEITLLSPATGEGAYYAEFGWVAAADSKAAVPTNDTRWAADTDTLSPGHPVTLTWDNGQGLRFRRVYTVDDSYLFTVTQTVENMGGQSVTLFPYGLVSRWGTPKADTNSSILHEGPIGVFDGASKEVKYKSLKDDDHLVEHKTTGGWLGFADKYWLTALVPDQKAETAARMSWRSVDGQDRYQTDWLGSALVVEPGKTVTSDSRLFAGAKELDKLDAYSKAIVPDGDLKLHLSIDFGMFWLLTIPFFHFLRFIHEHIPNFGIAIMVFTVIIKGAFFPIANKSYHAMSKMKKLQPEMKELQTRFADDKARLNQEMMALYKREKANPVSGCLPILIQIPVFFALYKVLYVTIEMRQAPFYGWIHDLSVPDPTNLFTLFGLIPWVPPEMLHIGIWPLIMGVTMWAQQKLNPQPTDPVQAKMFTFLPLIFTYMLARFPAGLVIYWAWSNSLSILQQWVIMKRASK
ncbi:MAG TPA: membrane protein insertase YidC [Candidatus Sulfotelmatobacter sp.]|jgi:YidC/Oxa1 family membrane protein insertase|nr:membrane protein insertase YidC [Candidatus Sulfotelmatobacter sp.]